MRRDELASVVLEHLLLRAGRTERLPEQDEIGDPADEVFDGRALGIDARQSGLPQGGAHVRIVIGTGQEMVKPAKNFSKLMLS